MGSDILAARDVDNPNFEAIPESLRKQERASQCLKIRNLVKEFGKLKAVNDLSLTMYSG